MQILGLLVMYFDAVVVEVKTFLLSFRLALAILWPMEQLLHYLYFQDIEDNKIVNADLMILTVKYNVKALLNFCSMFLESDLYLGNFQYNFEKDLISKYFFLQAIPIHEALSQPAHQQKSSETPQPLVPQL